MPSAALRREITVPLVVLSSAILRILRSRMASRPKVVTIPARTQPEGADGAEAREKDLTATLVELPTGLDDRAVSSMSWGSRSLLGDARFCASRASA